VGSVTVSTKGQVVLPAAVRRRMKIRPGTRLKLEVSPDGQAVTLRRPAGDKTSRVEDGFGLLKARRHVRIEDMDGARILGNLRARDRR
jgi:AbrB family looped-hinge helix DNA binding protein